MGVPRPIVLLLVEDAAEEAAAAQATERNDSGWPPHRGKLLKVRRILVLTTDRIA